MLALAMLMVLAIATLAAGLLQLTQASTRRQASTTNTKLAFYMAEAGLAEAYAGLTIAKTGNVGSAAEPAAFGEGLFWVQATENPDGTVDLTSTGMVGNGRALLSMVVERGESSVARLGLFSEGSLNIEAGALVDGYDSEHGSYRSQLVDGRAPAGAGRGGSNQGIAVVGTGRAPTLINGELTPGPLEGVSVTGEVTIVGATEPARAAAPLPPVQLPSLPVLPGVTHKSGVPLLFIPGENSLEFLEVGAMAEVVLQGPSTLVLGSLRLSPGAVLTFDSDLGAIDLFVVEELDLQPGSKVSTPGEDPGRVTIQVPASTADPIRLASSGPFHGVVYAPQADLQVSSSFEVFGALIGKNLQLDGPIKLHFDHVLDRLSAQSALPRQVSWRIIELSNPLGAQLGMDPFKYLGLDRTTLPLPAQAHADQTILLEYQDLGGLDRVYAGLESAFDWTAASQVTSLLRDGTTVNQEVRGAAPLPEPLLDLVDDLGRTSSEIKAALIAASPLSSTVLIAAVERVPSLSASDLKAVFESNPRTSDEALRAAISKGPLTSAELKDVLLINSPLSIDMLIAVQARVPAMSPGDLAVVLAAQ